LNKPTFFARVLVLVSLLSFNCIAAENIGVIEDPFFKSVDSVVSIRSLIPHDTKIMALVDASTVLENRSMSIVPFYTKTWIHDDDKMISKEKISATVICGVKELTKDFLREQEFPYLFMREVEDKNGNLTIGGRVTYYKIKEYQRPDQTLCRIMGDALYDLELKEERTSAGYVSVCIQEWEEFTQWKFKVRHRTNLYTSDDVYHVTTKIPYTLGMQDTPKNSIVSKVYYRKEIKFNSQQAEGPSCGTAGKCIPTGYVVIG